MKRLLAVLVVARALVGQPDTAQATQALIAPSVVRAMLLAHDWTPEAAEWAATHVRVWENTEYVGTRYSRTAPPEAQQYVVVGSVGSVEMAELVDYSMHVAWDDKPDARLNLDARQRDMERLATEPTLAGEWARETLAAGQSVNDNWHYMIQLLERAEDVGRGASAFPEWFRVRYFAYLKALPHRTFLPLG